MNFDVNKLRNSCAQNDAKVIEKDGKPIKAIDELIIDGTVNVIRDDKQTHIEIGFLSCIKTIRTLYE